MSNPKLFLNQFLSNNNYQIYPSFNQYLNNLFKYITIGNWPIEPINNYYNNYNQNIFLKYTKFNGSKNIILSNINSFPLNGNLNQNSNLENKIKENLSFISSNTKYINNIPIIHNNIINNNINNQKIFLTNKKSEFIIHNNEKENTNKNNNMNFQEINELNIIKENSEKNKYNPKLDLISNNSSTPNIYRQDYYIKQFKVQYSLWLRNILNSKLALFLSKIKNNKKFIKFYPLNSLKFTANPKYKDNKIFLSMKIKEILIIGINTNRNSNQKKNKENIELIEKMGLDNGIYDDLIEFLNITMEESINIFYKSEQFIKFKNSTQAKINDNKFFKEKKFSLLEENGFIFLIKNYNGNSKSEI